MNYNKIHSWLQNNKLSLNAEKAKCMTFHSEPIFKSLELLKIDDIYKLKILKLSYNLTNYCLPEYFNNYLNVINNELPHSYQLRINARPLIRLPKILTKNYLKSHSMSAISMYIANIYLNTYKFEYDLRFCYACGQSGFKTLYVLIYYFKCIKLH